MRDLRGDQRVFVMIGFCKESSLGNLGRAAGPPGSGRAHFFPIGEIGGPEIGGPETGWTGNQ